MTSASPGWIAIGGRLLHRPGGADCRLPATRCRPRGARLRKPRFPCLVPPEDGLPPPRCARIAGFSRHAGRCVETHDRPGLEHRCRYGLRPPISAERLAVLPDGRISYVLSKPWTTDDGRRTPELVLDPIDFMHRLAVLVPPPYGKHRALSRRLRVQEQDPHNAYPLRYALNGVFPTKRSEGMTEREVPDRLPDLLREAYAWPELRRKARLCFASGGFHRDPPDRPPLWDKVRASLRLLRAFLLREDWDKGGPLRDLTAMARAGTMHMEYVAHYLLMVEALSGHVGRLVRDREMLWRWYVAARKAVDRAGG